VKVAKNQMYLYERGLSAYTDVSRRLEAVILTVLPSETEVVQPGDSFASNLNRVNQFRHEEDFGVAAATVLVSTLLVHTNTTRARTKLVGALTVAPVDWTAVPLVNTAVCETDMGEPYAKYGALLNNNTLLIMDTERGVYVDVPLDIDEPLVWLCAAGGHMFAGSTTSLYEFDTARTERLVLSPLPASNRMDKNPPTITYPVPGSSRVVTLCLASKQVSADAQDADVARSELRDAVGAYRNHVFRNGQVLVSLPAHERIVAAHALDTVVDVFTESNDWWRVWLDTKRALVVGLDVDGASVRDVVSLPDQDDSLEDMMARLSV
jgi:hypothetical protein